MEEKTINAEDLPEAAKVTIQCGSRGRNAKIKYGNARVEGVVHIEIAISAVGRTEVVLECIPGDLKEVEAEMISIEGVVQDVQLQGEGAGARGDAGRCRRGVVSG